VSLLTRVTAITARIASNFSLDEDKISWDFLGAPHPDEEGQPGPFKPPAIDMQNPEASIWLRPMVRPVAGSSRPWGINDAPRFQRGIIVGQVFFPRYSSPALGLEYADEFFTLFHRETIGAVRCEDANGPDFIEVGAWPNFKPVQVLVPFYLYEVS